MILNTAVIGVGTMGKHHARIYSELENSKLVAISDLNEHIGKAVAKSFSCKFYSNYKEMLEKEDIDAVSIVVPTKFHKEVALDCIKAGKHVLVEKPISDTTEGAEEIISEAKKHGVSVAVGHVERFNPAVQRLKKLIDDGKLGEITSLVAKRVGLFPPQIRDANVIIDLATHDIDIFNYLLNKEPTNVHASAGKALINKREDYAEIFLEYNGADGIIQVNWITPVKIRNLSVTGTGGYAELNYISQELTMYESRYERKFSDFGDFIVKFAEPKRVDIPIKKQEPLKLELMNFLESIDKGREPLVNGEAGLRALKTALEAVEIARRKYDTSYS